MNATRRIVTARRHTWNGFSLGGMMVAGTILATVATVALPSYSALSAAMNHADAAATLTRLFASQQRYYLGNLRYATTTADLGFDDEAADGHYRIDVARASHTGFTLRATARPESLGRVESACSVLTLDDRGNRSPAECW